MGRITSLAMVFVLAFVLSTTGFAQGWGSSKKDSNTRSKTTSAAMSGTSTKKVNPATLKALGRMTKTLSDAKKTDETTKKKESGRYSRY